VPQRGSGRQPSSPAKTACLQHSSPGACRHPVPKSMSFRPLTGVWLERPLHLSLVSFDPVPHVRGISRRGGGPVKQVQSTRQDKFLHLARENTGPPDGRDRPG